MLLCEPLHDVSKHIENIFEELLKHVSIKHADLFSETVKASLWGKEVIRSVDNRMALIKVTTVLYGQLPLNVENLLVTFCEMQLLLYQNEEDRTPRSVLRYYNISFRHALMCKLIIGYKTKAMTTRKFHGKYFHNLINHVPMQLRKIVSGRSTNVENRERVFNTFKQITKSTSSYRPGHIIGNLFVRLQGEEKLRGLSNRDAAAKEEAEISKLFEPLKTILSDTQFTYFLLSKFERDL